MLGGYRFPARLFTSRPIGELAQDEIDTGRTRCARHRGLMPATVRWLAGLRVSAALELISFF